MKRFAIILSILSVSFFSMAAFAEEQMDMPQRGKGMMHQQPTMIATSDGGVVVLAGGKLSKYDGLLNLVKEVEIKRGPSPKKIDEMNSEETPQPDPSFKPMDDAQIAAMMEQDSQAEAPVAPEPTPGQ